MTSSSVSDTSPGNSFFPQTPPMRLPSLSFLYRLECEVAQEIAIGAPHSAGLVRVACNIISGTVQGPRIEGTVLPGGADWAQGIEGTNAAVLDARYVVKTSDGQHLYITVYGHYRPGPGTAYSRAAPGPESSAWSTVTQDDVEFFSHIRIEAGPGKYNWLNGLIAVGVMTHVKDRIVIDAYYLTNFPGLQPDDVVAKFPAAKGVQE